jgi:exonuclease III
MIPGFNVYIHELYDTTCTSNNGIHNPYDRSHQTHQIGDMIANEEEHNSVWSEISDLLIKCKYKQPKNTVQSKISELKILSLNIRSLSKNINALKEEIELYQKFDVICLNETNCIIEKLPNGLTDILLDGFHDPIVQAPIRSSGRGGGLAIYINKNVCEYDQIEKFDPNPEPNNVHGEFQFVKINRCKGYINTVILGNVYRSPSRSPDNFNTLFDMILNKLNRHSKKQVLIVGDFNIDHIQHDNDIHSQHLIDNTTSHGFIQVVSRPTRITDHSATLIDHVYTNKIANLTSCDILTLDLSDHLAIVTTFLLGISTDKNLINNAKKTNPENVEFRIFKEANDLHFKQLLEDEHWTDVLDGLDAQGQYNKFIETYTKHYNTAYPLISQRTRRKKERLNPKPWILPWLEEACDRKNRLYHDFVKHPSVSNKTKYDKMKKFTEKHIKKSKNSYYKKYFDQYKDNSKKQWQLINSLLNRTAKKINIAKLVDSDGKTINTPIAIAESFNNYFSNIAANLKQEISSRTNHHPNDFQKFLTSPVVNSIYLKPVVGSEVFNIIQNLKNKATLDTKISTLKIASTCTNFNFILAQVITSSFEQGVFPKPLKLARVVPIFKGGSKTDVANYRPISLLATFSKIYEKLMHRRLVDFMESNNSIFDMQYGFRSGRSCEHALLKAQSLLLNSLGKKEISLLLFIDFSKAFDMVDHNILLKKLEHYGIRGTALDWLKSYLNDREQFVTLNGKDSSKKPLKFGVPQGSILGPLLFIIYINDLPQISKYAKFIMYADDANIIITGKSVDEINEKFGQLSTSLLSWVDTNGLKLNLKKTNFMIFSRQKIVLPNGLHVASTKIERKTEARFLGIIMDEKLNFTHHINALKSKMSRYVGVMYRLKGLIPVSVMLQIYHSFIQSHINYCSLVWGFSAKSNIEALFARQKKGIRAVMPGFVNYFYKDGTTPAHTKPGFKKYRILTVHGVIVMNALILMQKVKHFPSTIPLSVSDTIDPNSPLAQTTPNHETCKDWLEACNNNYSRKSVFFKGPLLYVDENIANLNSTSTMFSINAYKTRVKRHILEQQCSGDDNDWLAENFLLYQISGLRKSNRPKNENWAAGNFAPRG